MSETRGQRMRVFQPITLFDSFQWKAEHDLRQRAIAAQEASGEAKGATDQARLKLRQQQLEHEMALDTKKEARKDLRLELDKLVANRRSALEKARLSRQINKDSKTFQMEQQQFELELQTAGQNYELRKGELDRKIAEDERRGGLNQAKLQLQRDRLTRDYELRKSEIQRKYKRDDRTYEIDQQRLNLDLKKAEDDYVLRKDELLRRIAADRRSGGLNQAKLQLQQDKLRQDYELRKSEIQRKYRRDESQRTQREIEIEMELQKLDPEIRRIEAQIRALNSRARLDSEDDGRKLTQTQIDGWAEGIVHAAEQNWRDKAVQNIQRGFMSIKDTQRDVENTDRADQKAAWIASGKAEEDFKFNRMPSVARITEQMEFLNLFTDVAGFEATDSFSDFIRIDPNNQKEIDEFINGTQAIRQHVADYGHNEVVLGELERSAYNAAILEGFSPAQATELQRAVIKQYHKRGEGASDAELAARKRFFDEHRTKFSAKLRETLLDSHYARTGKSAQKLGEQVRKDIEDEHFHWRTLSTDIVVAADAFREIGVLLGDTGKSALSTYAKVYLNKWATFLGVEGETSWGGFGETTPGATMAEVRKKLYDMSVNDVKAKGAEFLQETADDTNLLGELVALEQDNTKHSKIVQKLADLNTALGAVFTSFRQTITGAQASAKELEWLARTIFDTEGTYDQMKGQLDFWYVAATATAERLGLEAELGFRLPPTGDAAQRYLYNITRETMLGHRKQYRFISEAYIKDMIEKLGVRGFWAYRYFDPDADKTETGRLSPERQQQIIDENLDPTDEGF